MDPTTPSKKSIRPLIPNIIEENVTSVAEQFQNSTLRPILKLQNELLLQVFHHYIQQRKDVFYRLAEQRQETYIQESIQKDAKFREGLIGMIIGHFTTEECVNYFEQEKELRKRITTLLIQRFQDQLRDLQINTRG